MIPSHLKSWLRQVFNLTLDVRRFDNCFFRPRLEPLESRQLPAVFLVTSTANGVAGGGDGTLRAAILAANANPGPDTIEFDFEPGGNQAIDLTSPLPTLTDTVTIDGTSQPGWISTPLITVDGFQIPFASNGLTTTANGCKIEGLWLQNFKNDGIALYSNNNIVTGNMLYQNGINGVEIANAVSGNIIGGTTIRARNDILGNTANNILITEDSSNNAVEGNYIGTTSNGLDLGHDVQDDGVDIDGGAGNNTIGGTAPDAGNLISGSDNDGVFIDASSSGNQLVGNMIGTDVTGDKFLGNIGNGVEIQGSNNTVGGTAGDGNLISGNGNDGVLIGSGATGNQVLGNRIGTNTGGTAALANRQAGVLIFGTNNTVGGISEGAGNLISGNDIDGIDLRATNSVVFGNKIGTTATGLAALANGGNGITVDGLNNTVGGTVAGAGNVIAFNDNDGVFVGGHDSGNAIRHNSISANAHLGIELADSDGLGNNNQPAPTLTSATFSPTTNVLTIKGSLTSTASTKFSLDFFANAIPVSPPVLEGEVYLGSFNVTTNAQGLATFTAKIAISFKTPFSTETTPIITATATDPNGNTSEFSNAVRDPEISSPAFTSAKAAVFTVTTPGSFTVSASGFPVPTLTLNGTLPKGLTFNRNTGVLSGTPVAGTSGTYTLHFTARNGIGATVTQSFTLTIGKLVMQVAIPSQVSVTPPAKVTALGHNRYEAVFTLAAAAKASLTGQLTIAGITNMPTGVTYDSSTAAAFPAKSKTLTLAVVFTNTTTSSLAALLPGLFLIVDEIIA
jgi:hypothetical protein